MLMAKVDVEVLLVCWAQLVRYFRKTPRSGTSRSGGAPPIASVFAVLFSFPPSGSTHAPSQPAGLSW